MLFVIILLSLACIIISYFQNSLFPFRNINLPGPIRLPFIGSSYSFLQRKSEDFLKSIIHLSKEYSSPFQIWIGPKLFVMIYESDQIKTVLQNRSCLDKSIIYKIVEPIFGTGLLTAPASIWNENRKIIAPTFKTKVLQNFFDVFVQESLILSKELEKIGQNGNEIIHLEHLEICTLRISCDTMMGFKSKNIGIDHLNIIKSFKEIMRSRFRNVFLVPDIIFNLTSLRHKQQKVLNFSHSFVDEIIQEWTNKSRSMTTCDDTAHKTFFDFFMSSSFCNNKFTQKEIYDNVLTMIVTSSDTIAITMHFALFILANFSEIQEKVYKELLEIYGTEFPSSAPVKYEDLQYMNYLDCVIKETLRLFPTVPLIGRQLAEDLEMGNTILPKGTDIIMLIIQMHRNEKYWPNPLTFDPDRFLSKKNYQYYMPFSEGSRNCIGIKYAMMSMKVILATLIRTFVFKVNRNVEINEIELNMDIVLSTIEPLKIKIEKRNY